jgi:drug/metabolite transporter (DMT)-like permease
VTTPASAPGDAAQLSVRGHALACDASGDPGRRGAARSALTIHGSEAAARALPGPLEVPGVSTEPRDRAGGRGAGSAAPVPPIARALPGPRSARLPINVRLIACLAAVYLIWSSTYLVMRLALAELPPLLMASIRFAVAGTVMLAIARRRGAAWPSARQWLGAVPVGALLFLGGNGFVAIGEQSVSSGGAAVVCAMMPLWIGVLAAVSGERPSRREWLSLGLGFVGVLVLMGGPSLQGEPLHIAVILLAPVCWALGSILSRRQGLRAPSDTFMSAAMQMLAGSAALAIAGLARSEQLPAHISPHTWLAVGYLVVFGSVIGFTAYHWLLRNARPVVATSYAYVNPILAVVIGAVASGEALGITTLIANVLIVGAIALALGKPRPH